MPHQRLSLKFHHYGVRGSTLERVKSFLDGRTQQVVLDGITSSAAPVTSGVPQGTALLFLVYINDLPSCVKSSARLFADDCLMFRRINSSADAKAFQKDLDNLEHWQMKFNPNKFKVICITNKRKVIDSDYTIHGQILRRTDKAKYLGVTTDSNLSWNQHTDTITKKANNTIAFLRRNLSSCPLMSKLPVTRHLCAPSLNMHQASGTLTHSLISIRLRLCSTEWQDL